MPPGAASPNSNTTRDGTSPGAAPPTATRPAQLHTGEKCQLVHRAPVWRCPGFTGVHGGRVPPRLSLVDTVLALGFSKHKCGPTAHLCRNGSELGRKPIRPMRLPQDSELDLAVRCAWLSFIAGRTHEEIAERVGASRTRVTRLIQLAQRAGLVKIFVEGSSAVCAALEERVRSGFALDRCSIAPDLDESDLPLLALGSLGARVLASILVRDNLAAIGVGHGRTLAAAVSG